MSETWNPTDSCSEIMRAHNVTSEMVSRVIRAQGKLMLAMHYISADNPARGYVIEAADALGLPPETWESTP